MDHSVTVMYDVETGPRFEHHYLEPILERKQDTPKQARIYTFGIDPEIVGVPGQEMNQLSP